MIPQLLACESVVDQVLEMLSSALMAADPLKIHHIVLTGGGAGTSINNRLADVARKVPDDTWAKTHFWWGDERFVETNSPRRNDYRIELSLGDFYIENNVHRVKAANEVPSASVAADDYAHKLIEFGSAGRPPQFTFVMLGVGPDGHIASLFPDSPQLQSSVIAVPVFDSPKPPPIRVTLSYPTLNNSHCTVLLLAGESKRDALAAIMKSQGQAENTPARGIEATELYAVTDLSVPV